MPTENRYLYLVRPEEEESALEVVPDGPLDVELVGLDSELAAAGRQARVALQGRTQPTRYYTLQLRARLLERVSAT
jgi:hypothetical protein